MNEMLHTILINVGIPGAISIICLIIAHKFPKQKALDITGAACEKFGRLVSAIGNTRLGKKSMDKLENDIISKIVDIVINGAQRFLKGCKADNIKESVEKKIDKNLLNSFNDAMKK